MSHSKLLSIQNVYFSYEEDWILQNWSGTLKEAELCHVKGPNGRGKSTLLRIIAGILRPSSGVITHCFQHSFSTPTAYVGHRLGLHPFLTVRENLAYGFASAVEDQLNRFLDELKLHDCLDKELHILSQGQAHKISLIQMLLQHAELWIMDEPFTNLDDVGETWLWHQMLTHQSQGGSVIFTAHQKNYAGVLEWNL